MLDEGYEMQELYCHNCNGYVAFPVDLRLDGNHVVNCPKCGHEHCRVVKNGRITAQRWDSRNPTHYVLSTNVHYYLNDSSTTTGTNLYINMAWLQTSA